MSESLNRAARLPAEQPAATSPQALEDRRELAFVAIERTRMPMLITDPSQPDNPIVLANQAFLDLSGYSAEEVLGRNWRFLHGPRTDPEQVRRVEAAILAEREATVELLDYRKDGSPFWNELFLSPIHGSDGALLYYFASLKDISKRHQANALEVEEFRLLREVDHRAKNALALVQGIVRLSRADDPAAYAAAVQSRVEALARAHSLLSVLRWKSVPIARLFDAEAEPFGRRRISFTGAEVEVAAEQVQPLGLIIHEMLSNAVQHGALSAPSGSVEVRWEKTGGVLAIDWRETGGPPPSEERVPSFGSTLIAATIERQLNGRVAFDWKTSGLEARLDVPLERAAKAG